MGERVPPSKVRYGYTRDHDSLPSPGPDRIDRRERFSSSLLLRALRQCKCPGGHLWRGTKLSNVLFVYWMEEHGCRQPSQHGLQRSLSTFPEGRMAIIFRSLYVITHGTRREDSLLAAVSRLAARGQQNHCRMHQSSFPRCTVSSSNAPSPTDRRIRNDVPRRS